MYDHIKLLIVIEYLFTLLCCCWVDVKRTYTEKKGNGGYNKVKVKVKVFWNSFFIAPIY